MFLPEPQVKIWLCTQPTDMRKSYDGLSALARHQLGENPLSGQWFVFINRRQTQMKVLYFESSGYCIWSKRLEAGRFQVRRAPDGKRQLDWTQLKWLLDGIEVQQVRQYKRYRHAA